MSALSFSPTCGILEALPSLIAFFSSNLCLSASLASLSILPVLGTAGGGVVPAAVVATVGAVVGEVVVTPAAFILSAFCCC